MLGRAAAWRCAPCPETAFPGVQVMSAVAPVRFPVRSRHMTVSGRGLRSEQQRTDLPLPGGYREPGVSGNGTWFWFRESEKPIANPGPQDWAVGGRSGKTGPETWWGTIGLQMPPEGRERRGPIMRAFLEKAPRVSQGPFWGSRDVTLALLTHRSSGR